jgi:STE24 endopeptidase
MLDRVLDLLNASRWSAKLPVQLKGIYDEDKYQLSQNYLKVKAKFSVFVSSISFIGILLILLYGVLGIFDEWIRQFSSNPLILGLMFFGIIGLISDLFGTPFSLYSIFVIEEKFGFNKTTPKVYFMDKLKGYFVSALIGGLILSLIIWLYEALGNQFWIVAWVVLTVFMIFMTMFYSNLIVPLFNKQKPLEEGELRDAINEFATKVGFKLDNIYVIDGSKRSTKANAYFTGLGMKKRIVLYDTLIKDHSTEELVAVLAHEIGHYKLKHTLSSIVFSVAQSGIMLYVLSLFIAKDSEISLALAQALGAKEASFHIGLIGFGILYSPLSMILGLIMNVISRKNEYAADHYAAVNYSAEHLGTALKKLSVNNLSNLNPHPAYVFFHYSHPTLLQRLNAMERL